MVLAAAEPDCEFVESYADLARSCACRGSLALVPATASTNWRVKVAIPDIRPRKFSAVRSPVSSARAGPSTSAA